MGLLDLTKSVLGNQGTGNHAVVELLASVIGNQSTGGLSGLVQRFEEHGLQDIVSSWVSTGQNLPVSPDQLQSVFSGGQLQGMAEKLGMSPDVLNGRLSQLLPQMVDHLTPSGTVPEHGAVESGLSMLKNLLNK
jgi:uncharacterized protein YidB (DUF937 family)